MLYNSLTDYVKYLKKLKQLSIIDCKVDPYLEVGEIASRCVKQNKKALLFTNVKGAKYSLFMNGFGSSKRMALSLGYDNINDLKKPFQKLLNNTNLSSPFSALFSTAFSGTMGIFPLKMTGGDYICEKTDFTFLPALQTYSGDGGKFITMGLTFLIDPETKKQNCGMYRLQIYDKNTLGLHIHSGKDGDKIFQKYKALNKPMPVSIVVGCEPSIIYSATAPLPFGFDEIMLAGFLRKSPLHLRKCVTNDIYVPYHSEFVFEGYVDCNETRLEGPFGDHTGYYSKADYYPVFHSVLTARRHTPIFMATVTGKPIMEDYFLGLATEKIFLPILKMLCPEIYDLHFFPEGIFHGCVIVSIDNCHCGAVRKVLNFVWGSNQLMFSKFVIIVDIGVNINDFSEVLWRLFNNVDLDKDLYFEGGSLDILDRMNGGFGTKCGIDATDKTKYRKGIMPSAEIPQKIINLVDSKWGDYNIS